MSEPNDLFGLLSQVCRKRGISFDQVQQLTVGELLDEAFPPAAIPAPTMEDVRRRLPAALATVELGPDEPAVSIMIETRASHEEIRAAFDLLATRSRKVDGGN